eukprot:jgi/Mesen1/5521/ME000279S04730
MAGRKPSPVTPVKKLHNNRNAQCASLVPTLLHLLACLACMLVGFRISKEGFLLLVRPHLIEGSNEVAEAQIALLAPSWPAVDTIAKPTKGSYVPPHIPPDLLEGKEHLWPGDAYDKFSREEDRGHIDKNSPGSRVGRHGILVKENTQPDPQKVSLAHELLGLLQEVQHRTFEVYPRRRILAITPTYRRTFQALHWSGVVNSLRMIRAPLTWIVVEAGGKSNETSASLAASGLAHVHLYIRKQRMEGVVVFVDDSNVHTPEFFEEAQAVRWFGAGSVGILLQKGFADSFGGEALGALQTQGDLAARGQSSAVKASWRQPVQGPACSDSNVLLGWHTFPHSPEDTAAFPKYPEGASPEGGLLGGATGSARRGEESKSGGEGRGEGVSSSAQAGG